MAGSIDIIARPGSNKRVEFRKRVTMEGRRGKAENRFISRPVKNLIAVNREREEWNTARQRFLRFYFGLRTVKYNERIYSK